MATIAFNALGTALGGPIGGAIGALAGRQVDAALFGPATRQGPRLKDREVTTSSYGQPLPRHFGRMRVAGSVIWATDLVEHSETRGGKGAPATTTFSYTASFAVALSSRPILALGRIWADGRLLRGAAGDLKVAGTLRIHPGTGDQPPDPLLLAAEGADRCPAHRGLAYVVFEDLDLSEFYNRLPALTFEVIADDGFDLGVMIAGVVDDCDAAVPLPGLAGFTCDGAPADALEVLGQVIPLETDAAGERLTIAPARNQGAAIALPEPAIAAGDDGFGGAAGYARHRAPATERALPVLRYLDLDRDFLPGAQYPSGPPGPGEPAAIDLPAAMDAASARSLIEAAARRTSGTRDRIEWRTATLDPAVGPGTVVELPGLPGRWRVLEWEWRAAGIELALARVAPVAIVPAPADPGRALPPEDLPAAATMLIAFELPVDPASPGFDQSRPFAAVAAGAGRWHGAALFADRGDGALLPLGPSGRVGSVTGVATTVLPAASPLLLDRASSLTVRLGGPDMALAGAGLDQLDGGANLALVGEELVQFAQATALGDGCWRLSGFLRGLGATEAGIATHAEGDPFVLIDGRAVAIDAATLGDGTDRQVVAIGRADPVPVAAPVLLSGLTLRPPAPVHPRRTIAGDGGWRLCWTRRARGNWPWQDGIDVPLVEEAERYLVTLGPVDAPLARWTCSEPRLDLDAGQVAGLIALSPGAPFRVRQQGTRALSDPLTLCNLPEEE